MQINRVRFGCVVKSAAILVMCVHAGCGMAFGPPVKLPSYAKYKGFYLTTTNDGATFGQLTVEKTSMPAGTFKVTLPSGKAMALENLVLDDIKADGSFEDMGDGYLSSFTMTLQLVGDEIDYFSFEGVQGNPTPRRGRNPAILIHLPSGKEVDLPLTRAAMEGIFGKDYKSKGPMVK